MSDAPPDSAPQAAASNARPRFDREVPPGGYAWWYCDALSDDGRFGLTIIGFVGSVFSPYYRAGGWRRPENHVAINVALYGPGASRWTMTERGSSALERDSDHLAVGPSSMRWDAGGLTITIDEMTPLLPRRVRGTVRLTSEGPGGAPVSLDPAGRHHWHPIAPRARIAAEFATPSIAFTANAYHDANWGVEPLETAFRQWNWSRANDPEGTTIFYDPVLADDSAGCGLALRFTDGGEETIVDPPPFQPVRKAFWGMRGAIRSESPPERLIGMEDGPFYTRGAYRVTLGGAPAVAVHESLDLARFASPITQAMLPFRMPRRFV